MTARRTAETEEMIALYNDQKQSTIAIGKRYGIHPTLVARRLKRAGVVLRQQGPQLVRQGEDGRIVTVERPSVEELRHAYIDLNLTQTEIAAKYGTYQNTVKHWLKASGITKPGTTRNAGDPKRVSWLDDVEATATTLDCDDPDPDTLTVTPTGAHPSNAELRRLHVDEGLSHGQIGQRFGVATSTVKSWCRRAGLVGARKAARADKLARYTAEAKARAEALDAAPGPRPLRKIAELPPDVQGKAHAALSRFVAWARAKRLAREFAGHGEEELL